MRIEIQLPAKSERRIILDFLKMAAERIDRAPLLEKHAHLALAWLAGLAAEDDPALTALLSKELE